MSNFFKKKTRNMLRDESAVSPMIATIMLIAVVAVLGAVLAASSMASAGNVDTSNFAVTLKAAQVGPENLNIALAHAGGDKLPTNKLTYSVTSGENSAPKFEKMVFNSTIANYTIASPITDPITFTAGNDIRFRAVTDGILDNGTAAITSNGFGIYHVVIRYDNQKVLYDSNIEIS